MREMSIYIIGTEASLSFSEESDTDNFIFRLILSNKLLYDLCFFM